jgi:hypothetical protein
MQRSAASEAGLSAPTILDNHANPACIDMTIAASYPLFDSCWPEVCGNAGAIGKRGRWCEQLAHPALACRHRRRPAYETPLFTRYAIKARR